MTARVVPKHWPGQAGTWVRKSTEGPEGKTEKQTFFHKERSKSGAT